MGLPAGGTSANPQPTPLPPARGEPWPAGLPRPGRAEGPRRQPRGQEPVGGPGPPQAPPGRAAASQTNNSRSRCRGDRAPPAARPRPSRAADARSGGGVGGGGDDVAIPFPREPRADVTGLCVVNVPPSPGQRQAPARPRQQRRDWPGGRGAGPARAETAPSPGRAWDQAAPGVGPGSGAQRPRNGLPGLKPGWKSSTTASRSAPLSPCHPSEMGRRETCRLR